MAKLNIRGWRRAPDGSVEVVDMDGTVRPANPAEARAFVSKHGTRIEASPTDTTASDKAATGIMNTLTAQGPPGTEVVMALSKDPEAFKYALARLVHNNLSTNPANMAGFMRKTLGMRDVSLRNGEIYVGGSPLDPEGFNGVSDSIMDLTTDAIDDIGLAVSIPGGAGFWMLAKRAIAFELSRQLAGNVAGLGPENINKTKAVVGGLSVGAFGRILSAAGTTRQKIARGMSDFIKKPGVRRVVSSLMSRLANITSGGGIDAGRAFAFRVKTKGDFPTMQSIADRLKLLLSRSRAAREANIPEFKVQRDIVDANPDVPTDLSEMFSLLASHSRGAATSDSGRTAISRVATQAFSRILDAVEGLRPTDRVSSAGTASKFMSLFKQGKFDTPMTPSLNRPGGSFDDPRFVFGQQVERVTVRDIIKMVPSRVAENIKRLVDDDASYALPGMVDTVMPSRVASAAMSARTAAKNSLESVMPPAYAEANKTISAKLASVDEMIDLVGKDVAKNGPERMANFILNRGGEEEMRRVANFDSLFGTNFAPEMFKAGVGRMMRGAGGNLEAIPAFTATGSLRGPAATAAIGGFTLGPFLPPGMREPVLGAAGLAGLFAMASPQQVGRSAAIGLRAEPFVHRALNAVGETGTSVIQGAEQMPGMGAITRLLGRGAGDYITGSQGNMPAEVIDAMNGQRGVTDETLNTTAQREDQQKNELLRLLLGQSDMLAPTP